jgi:hypothetical protein
VKGEGVLSAFSDESGIPGCNEFRRNVVNTNIVSNNAGFNSEYFTILLLKHACKNGSPIRRS